MVSREKGNRVSDCGLWAWRPHFLQVFNKPIVFLILFSVACFCTTISVGMNQVLMPALQQLFNMTSKQMGCILISNDLSGFVVAFVFGHFSSRGKVRWIFFGLVVVLMSCLLQSGTQLFVQLPETTAMQNGSSPTDTTCNTQSGDGYTIAGQHSSADQEDFYAVKNNKLFWVLFVAGMLHGIGNTPLMMCGMTYLDEIMTEKKLGPAIAFSNVLNYMAFPVSFVLGAFLIQQYVTLGDAPPGVTPEDSHWVGAWWMGYLIPAILLLITGIPLLLFPTQMPAAKGVLMKKIQRGESTEEEKDAELNRSFRELIADMIPTLKRLAKNNALVFLLFGEAFNNIFLSSMPFDTKLYSLLFKMPISKTGIVLGGLRTVATLVGLVIGGTIVGKLKLSGRGCMRFVVITQLLTLPLTLLTLWHCTPAVVAGIDTPYPGDTHLPGAMNLTSSCNADCGCSTQFYEPSCDVTNGITYFSPCHAGCSSTSKHFESRDVEVYTDCSCSSNLIHAGPCPSESNCTRKMWIVFISQNLLGIIVFISAYPALHVTYLRIVNEIDRSATQGAKMFFTRAFGFLLGPIIFGSIIDSYCGVWRGDGGASASGSCHIYDLNNLIMTFSWSQTALRICCALSFFLSWRLYPEKSKYQGIEKIPDCIDRDVEDQESSPDL